MLLDTCLREGKHWKRESKSLEDRVGVLDRTLKVTEQVKKGIKVSWVWSVAWVSTIALQIERKGSDS